MAPPSSATAEPLTETPGSSQGALSRVPRPEDADDVVNVHEAAAILGVSEPVIHRRITEGILPATRPGPHQPWRLRRTEILEVGDRIRKAPALKGWSERGAERGQIAQQAFPLFDEGIPLDKIVVRLGVDPKLIKELFAEWTQLVNISQQWLSPQGSSEDPRAAVGPAFNHQPNEDWTCCSVHKMLKEAADLEAKRARRRDNASARKGQSNR